MSNDGPIGDIVEVAYAGSFCEYQNPALLNYVAAAAGYPPRALGAGFRYLELGCGLGVTANVMAAALPQGEFWGVDVNGDHVASARRQAEDSEVTNITFVESEYAGIAEDDLPEFDFITLHGVYSWVSAQARDDIRKILAAKLKPGGIAYIMYSAQPGRAAVQPLRRLLVDYVGQGEGDLARRVEAGLQYLNELKNNEAQYFVRNPVAAEVLAKAVATRAEVAAHEFLSDDWAPHYFVDVAREMAACGLAFAGQAATARNDVGLMLPDGLKPLVEAFEDPLQVEQAKDFALNTGLRVDVYVRADAPVPAAERSGLFDDLIFGTTKTLASIEREVQFPPGRLSLAGPLYDEILEACSVVAHSMAEIRALPAVAKLDPAQQLDALHYLISAGQLAPFAAASDFGRSTAPGGDGPQFALRCGYNRRAIEGLGGARPAVLLASPVLGTGIEIDPLPALILRTLVSVGAERAPGQLWERIVGDGLGDMIEGWPADAVDEQAPFTMNVLTEFMEDRLVKLLDLGVLGFAPPQ